MTTATVYIYKGENGVVQTPIKLALQADSTLVRLIAGSGKELANGTVKTTCIDVKSGEESQWTEIDMPETDKPQGSDT